jgi:hypothetical protein
MHSSLQQKCRESKTEFNIPQPDEGVKYSKVIYRIVTFTLKVFLPGEIQD